MPAASADMTKAVSSSFGFTAEHVDPVRGEGFPESSFAWCEMDNRIFVIIKQQVNTAIRCNEN